METKKFRTDEHAFECYYNCHHGSCGGGRDIGSKIINQTFYGNKKETKIRYKENCKENCKKKNCKKNEILTFKICLH